MVEGEGQIVFFLEFFTSKSILWWPIQIKEFSRKSYHHHLPPPPGPLFLITTPSFYAGFLADPENLENSEKSWNYLGGPNYPEIYKN